MNQIVTEGIILTRTNFGEADRIITFLTKEHGKLRLLAKGVKKINSKLAGGIEIFSISQISFVKGRGEIGTLVSTRLIKHYGAIVKDLDRTMLGYDLIKDTNKVTEDQLEPDYFDLLQISFEALEDRSISLEIIKFWYNAQLLRLTGHIPNLDTDQTGKRLSPNDNFIFNYDESTFEQNINGKFTANHIKFLRLAFQCIQPKILSKISYESDLTKMCAPLLGSMIQDNLRI